MRESRFEASQSVIGPIPLRASRIPCQSAGTSSPSGLTAPIPVTTTRRDIGLHLLDCWSVEEQDDALETRLLSISLWAQGDNAAATIAGVIITETRHQLSKFCYFPA
jgi:hypothetical protein